MRKLFSDGYNKQLSALKDTQPNSKEAEAEQQTKLQTLRRQLDAQLRRSPLLVADMNGDGGTSLIIVNTESPARSLLFGWGE